VGRAVSREGSRREGTEPGPVSKTWADAGEKRPEKSRHGGERRVARRQRVRRRRIAGLLLLAAAGVVLAIVGTSLARDDDGFSGVWWEPDSGRRVEIVREGDGFTLLYGAERRPFAAERRGDELVIAAPLGDDIIVRAVAADRLELVDGGRTTTLRPAPDGS
jgi:hypothetical protein